MKLYCFMCPLGEIIFAVGCLILFAIVLLLFLVITWLWDTLMRSLGWVNRLKRTRLIKEDRRSGKH